MSTDLKELETAVEKQEAELRKLCDKFDEQDGPWTAEQEETWKTANEDFNKLAAKLERRRDLAAIEKRSDPPSSGGGDLRTRLERARQGTPSLERRTELERYFERQNRAAIAAERQHLALRGWARAQYGLEVADDEREAMKGLGVRPEQKEIEFQLVRGNEVAIRSAVGWHASGFYGEDHLALRMDTSIGSGGDTIPEGFVRNFERALLAFGGMRQVSQVIRTTREGDLYWPHSDDTSNEGVELAEAGTVTTQDIATDRMALSAIKYTSKLVKASSEILEDSAFNLATIIGSMLGERVARILNRRFTTGTGSGQPNGIVTAAPTGKTTATATAIVVDEPLELQHAVNPAYRNQPGSAYMCSDGILLVLRKLKDSNGLPIWNTDVRSGAPNTLWGKRVVINDHMAAAPVSQAVTMLFGDLSKYKIRDHASFRLRRADELFLETDEVGFVAFSRHDGDLLDAGTNPVQALKQAT